MTPSATATATAHREFTPGTPYTPAKSKDRFSPVPEWLSIRREVSPGAKLVYGRLARYAGRESECWPKMRTLAAEVGLSERQTRRYVDELRRWGLVRSIRQGLTRPNRYELLTHIWMISAPPETTPDSPPPRTDRPQESTVSAPPLPSDPAPESPPEIAPGKPDAPETEGAVDDRSGSDGNGISRPAGYVRSIPLKRSGKKKNPAPTPTAVLSHSDPDLPPATTGASVPAGSPAAESASGEATTTGPEPMPAEIPKAEPSPAPSPIPISGRQPAADSGPLAKLNDLCAEIETKARQTPGKRFNARAFVQAGLRGRKHPGAIEAALIQVAKAWTYLESPWPYANRILDVQSGNFHARDFERSSQALRDEINAAVDPAVMRLAGYVGTGGHL